MRKPAVAITSVVQCALSRTILIAADEENSLDKYDLVAVQENCLSTCSAKIAHILCKHSVIIASSALSISKDQAALDRLKWFMKAVFLPLVAIHPDTTAQYFIGPKEEIAVGLWGMSWHVLLGPCCCTNKNDEERWDLYEPSFPHCVLPPKVPCLARDPVPLQCAVATSCTQFPPAFRVSFAVDLLALLQGQAFSKM